MDKIRNEDIRGTAYVRYKARLRRVKISVGVGEIGTGAKFRG